MPQHDRRSVGTPAGRLASERLCLLPRWSECYAGQYCLTEEAPFRPTSPIHLPAEIVFFE